VSELKYQAIDYTLLATENLKPGDILIHNEELVRRIDQIAEDVAERYKGQRLMLVGLLIGADATLVRLREALFKIGFDNVETEYMQVRTRGEDLESSGAIEIIKDIPPAMLVGKNALLVDDIADSLTTFAGVANHFQPNGLASFATFSLLEKPARHKPELVGVPLDFVGFKIPDIWVEGFGLDSYGYGRGNPNIVFGPTPEALAFRDAQLK